MPLQYRIRLRIEAQLARVRLTREAREKLIVDGAVRFFAEVGFGGQTRELARQLRMSQSLLFKYFPTKVDLIDPFTKRFTSLAGTPIGRCSSPTRRYRCAKG
jgi:hypothetical protein